MANQSAIPVNGKLAPQVNRYYRRTSRIYLAAGLILLVALLLYCIAAVALWGEYITYDNLTYLVRDWSAMSFTGETSFSRLVYNAGENTRFAGFRGGVALCNGDTCSYYDGSGINLFDDALNFSSPVLRPSEKYMLVYDLGGTQYAVYNQLTRIIGREAGGRILYGSIADNGELLLVTRSRETRYVVERYNAAFNKTMSIYKDNYVMAADLSPDGNRIVICSAVPDASSLGCEIEICSDHQTEPIAQFTYPQTMPLDVLAADDGFILLTDTGVTYFDYDGTKVGAYNFVGMNIQHADLDPDLTVLTASTNALGSESRVIVLDGNGSVLYDEVFRQRIVGCYASGNAEEALGWLRTSDSVIRIKPNGGTETVPYQNGSVLSVIPMKRGVLVAERTGAGLFESNENETNQEG